jgi:hypothetical protein
LAARLTIIVPTHDGEGLESLFDSLEWQLQDGDEVLVVGDTFEGVPFIPTFKWARYIELDAGHHCFGHCQINYGIGQARGDYLMFIDDDDCIPDGALDAIRRAIAAQSEPRPLVFKFYSRRHGYALPIDHDIQESRIGGHAMVVPNIPDKLGRWGERYAGDYDWITSTLAHWPEGPAWHDDVIACA